MKIIPKEKVERLFKELPHNTVSALSRELNISRNYIVNFKKAHNISSLPIAAETIRLSRHGYVRKKTKVVRYKDFYIKKYNKRLDLRINIWPHIDIKNTEVQECKCGNRYVATRKDQNMCHVCSGYMTDYPSALRWNDHNLFD